MAKERLIHFNQLPQALRARLVESFESSCEERGAAEGAKTPRAIVADRYESFNLRVYYVMGGIFGALGMVVVAGHDYGQLTEQSVQSALWVGAYVGVLLPTLFVWLLWWELGARARHAPFKLGIYVYGLEVVDARQATLRVISTQMVERVEVEHHMTEGAYGNSDLKLCWADGTLRKVRVVGEAEAERLAREIETQRVRQHEALSRGDLDALKAKDPWWEVRQDPMGWSRYTAEHVKASDPAFGSMQPSWQQLLALAALLAIGLSPGLWAARERLNDDARYEYALKVPIEGSPNRIDALEAYLDTGGVRHRDEVIDRELPKAKLEQLRPKRSIQALRDYMQAHAGYPEHVSAAHGEVAALFGELRRRLDQIGAKTTNPEAVWAMKQTLDFLEREQRTQVDVIILHPTQAQLERVDEAHAALLAAARKAQDKTQGATKPSSPSPALAQAYASAHVQRRDEAIVGRMQLAMMFLAPREVMTLRQGVMPPEQALRSDEHGQLVLDELRVTRPTFILDYRLSHEAQPVSWPTQDEEDPTQEPTLVAQPRLEGARFTIALPEQPPRSWALPSPQGLLTSDESIALDYMPQGEPSPAQLAVSRGLYQLTNDAMALFFSETSTASRRIRQTNITMGR